MNIDDTIRNMDTDLITSIVDHIKSMKNEHSVIISQKEKELEELRELHQREKINFVNDVKETHEYILNEIRSGNKKIMIKGELDDKVTKSNKNRIDEWIRCNPGKWFVMHYHLKLNPDSDYEYIWHETNESEREYIYLILQ